MAASLSIAQSKSDPKPAVNSGDSCPIDKSTWPRHLIAVRIMMLLSLCLVSGPTRLDADDLFTKTIQPFFQQKCVKCHGQQKKIKGEIDLAQVKSMSQLLGQSELLDRVIDALDSSEMPPESEPELRPQQRSEILAALRKTLQRSIAQSKPAKFPVRRLNRFQYNYTVKDLFQLKLDVFPLPEKLMTRQTRYLDGQSPRMPAEVKVKSDALNPQPGMRRVKSFPKDLRAAHGFDNQANQLTLSPLLLDAFLRLSVSIVESPDFNAENVGIWQEFFQEPAQQNDLAAEVSQRLKPFLTQAFRREISSETVNRYANYTLAKIKAGASFTDAMKKVSSAVLSSPMFLYRYQSEADQEKQYELAANLSYFFWSSCPDHELLQLAKAGQLDQPEIWQATIDRMMRDPKIERLLDSFPAQWMQLENVLAATPDPQQQRLFRLDQSYPASLQMLVEPLLLFDLVFLEDRPLIELVSPKESFQSRFLDAWYHSDLQPEKLNLAQVLKQNQANDQRRQELKRQIAESQQALQKIIEPARQKILQHQQNNTQSKPVDLKPIGAWDFEGDLKSSIGNLDLSAVGKVEFEKGMVVLKKTYLLSQPIPVDLKEKTLEVWCVPHNLNQRGGGVMGIQGQGDFFDTIVLGERKARHWISGSNGFSRTDDFPDSQPETKPNQMIHLVMVYQADGTTLLYRNGQPYGKPFKKERAVFPKQQSRVIFGLRHLPAGGNRYLNVSIDQARLYNRALTPAEVQAANRGRHLFVTEQEIIAALSQADVARHAQLKKKLQTLNQSLKQVPANQDPARLAQQARQKFEEDLKRQLRDPTFRRLKVDDPRYGGVITNAAVMSMTSGPKRTHPIARGAWMIEVIFNDPPPPPPNDVPPLNEESGDQNLTIREKFKVHRENPDCAGCHSRLDPLGFAMENFDTTGRWRDLYPNGRKVDMGGTLLRKYKFASVIEFKQAIVAEEKRFAKAFVSHLMRFALARELTPLDKLKVDEIVASQQADRFRLRSLVKSVVRECYSN